MESVKETLINSSYRRRPVSNSLKLLDSGIRQNDGKRISQGFLNRNMAAAAGIMLAVLLLLVSGPGRAEPAGRVDQTIQYLISYASGSGLTFIRNGSKYTSSEAAEHMNRKYQHFKDDIETPEKFIELSATKSLLTGKPYLVVDGQGEKLRVSDWLRTELARYRVRSE